MKVKTPFVMTSTPFMKVARYLCKDKLRLLHFARTPTDIIDFIEIKEEGIFLCVRLLILHSLLFICIKDN